MISEMRFESQIRHDQRGLPLAQALAKRFTYHTLEDWTQKIEQGLVRCAGQKADPAQLAQLGQDIVYIVPDYQEPEVPTHYEVLLDEEEFLVAGKPAGAPVHHTGTIFYNTFTSILRRGTGYEELVPMHRLDRDTSGVMLFAKNQDTAQRYQKSLHHIIQRKIYLAVVRGDFFSDPQDVHIALREQPGEAIRCRMIPDPQGKECHTRFTRLGLLDSAQGPRALVECELFTGRKHQIRAHLAALGFPILGDPLYSLDGQYYLKRCHTPLDDMDYQQLGARTQMLHAWKLELALPGRRQAQIFESRIWTPEMGEWVLPSLLGN